MDVERGGLALAPLASGGVCPPPPPPPPRRDRPARASADAVQAQAQAQICFQLKAAASLVETH